LTFQPEGLEDLDILRNEQLEEAIQVKSFENLVLSNISTGEPNSFFHRAVDLLNSSPTIQIHLVNFGSIGEEMRLAWAGDEEYRARISKKLSEKGFDEDDTRGLYRSIDIVALSEGEIESEVLELPQEQMTGIYPIRSLEVRPKSSRF